MFFHEVPLSRYLHNEHGPAVQRVLRVEILDHLGVREPAFTLDLDESEAVLRFQSVNADKEVRAAESACRLGQPHAPRLTSRIAAPPQHGRIFMLQATQRKSMLI